MPGRGVQHVKTGCHVCNCHYDAENVSLSPYSNNDVSLPLKEESKLINSDDYSGTSNKLISPRSMNHWWEAPSRFGSGGKATSGLQDSLNSPSHSDLTFEGGKVSNILRDNASTITQINSIPFSKSNASISAERVCDSSNEQIANASMFIRTESPRSVRGRKLDIENMTIHEEASDRKDCSSRWTDENGKLSIQFDVFDTNLPSADEVGLQWKISELQIALRASESARLESEQETEALRKYLAEVEAAAAGLQSRVQELEHLITFSSKDGNWELEQLRAKIIMEVSKEARSQTVKAAKAVAAAREATMELDKIKRHASSVIKAQEEEAERLRMEAAECRTLYHARAGQLQGMKEKIERLEHELKVSYNSSNEALKSSQEEVITLQKSLDAAKIECHDKANQLTDVLEAFETRSKTLQSAEDRLKDLERERAELTSHNEWLEQQMQDLQSQGMVAAAADYDHELRKVKAMLGAEKEHLLSELMMLRRGNQNLQVKMVEWQEKYHALRQHMSTLGPLLASKNGISSMTVGDNLDVHNTKGQSYHGLDHCEYGKTTTEEGVDGHDCLSQTTESIRSCNLCLCQKYSAKKTSDNSNGHYSSQSKESGRKNRGLQQRSRSKNNTQSCSDLKDDLLTAAHREIIKLKEINQCLIGGRQGGMWHGNEDPEKENYQN